jgi:hypothetical protein
MAVALGALVTENIAAAGSLLMSRLVTLETSLHAGLSVVQRMGLPPAITASGASPFEDRETTRSKAWEVHDHAHLDESPCLGLGPGGSHLARESALRPPRRGLSPQAASTSKRRRSGTSKERRVGSNQAANSWATSAQEPWFARLRKRQKERRRMNAAAQLLAVADAAAQPLTTVASVTPPSPPIRPSGKGNLNRQEKRGGLAAKGKEKQRG